jgi:hypothetical protein
MACRQFSAMIATSIESLTFDADASVVRVDQAANPRPAPEIAASRPLLTDLSLALKGLRTQTLWRAFCCFSPEKQLPERPSLQESPS